MCALFVGWRPRRAGHCRLSNPGNRPRRLPLHSSILQEATKTDWLQPDLAAAAMTSPRSHPATALAARIDFPRARESHGRNHPSRSRGYKSGSRPRLAKGAEPIPTPPHPAGTKHGFKSGSLPADHVGPPDAPTRCKKCEKNQKIFRIYLPFLIKTCYKDEVV